MNWYIFFYFSIYRYNPNKERFPIIVSQDCGHKPTADVIQRYVGEYGIQHIKVCVTLPLSPSLSLSHSLSPHLFLCLFFCLSICLFLSFPLLYLSIYISFCLCVSLFFLSVYLLLFLSIFLSVSLFFCLSICTSFYLSCHYMAEIFFLLIFLSPPLSLSLFVVNACYWEVHIIISTVIVFTSNEQIKKWMKIQRSKCKLG